MADRPSAPPVGFAVKTTVRCAPLVALIAFVPAIVRGALTPDVVKGASVGLVLGLIYVFLVALAFETFRLRRNGRPH